MTGGRISILAGACLIATTPALAGRLCLSEGQFGWEPSMLPCEMPAPPRSVEWIGFSDEKEHPNTWCTTCACALPEFCPCCPYDDTFSLCDAGYHDAVWTISSSGVDPLVVDGEIAEDGRLYVWLAEKGAGDLCDALFTFSGSLTPYGFEPAEGVVVQTPEDFPTVWLVLPAEAEVPLLVGRVLVQDPTPVESRSWGRTKALYRN